jgi:hypothetical protein
MNTDSVFIEAAFALGRHSGSCELTEDGAAMFARILDLTVRAGIANTPDLWASRETGRTYLLGVVARIAEEAERLAGKGNEITADVIRQASNRLIDEQRERLGMPAPDRAAVVSKFCFAYVLSDLFEER